MWKNTIIVTPGKMRLSTTADDNNVVIAYWFEVEFTRRCSSQDTYDKKLNVANATCSRDNQNKDGFVDTSRTIVATDESVVQSVNISIGWTLYKHGSGAYMIWSNRNLHFRNSAGLYPEMIHIDRFWSFLSFLSREGYAELVKIQYYH